MVALDTALALAAEGKAVFPCNPANKRPYISKEDGGNGFHDATDDLAQVLTWWDRYPDALIGVPTGRENTYDILDFDLNSADPIKAAGARGYWAEIKDTLPPTVVYKTRSGGIHVRFKSKSGLRCRHDRTWRRRASRRRIRDFMGCTRLPADIQRARVGGMARRYIAGSGPWAGYGARDRRPVPNDAP